MLSPCIFVALCLFTLWVIHWHIWNVLQGFTILPHIKRELLVLKLGVCCDRLDITFQKSSLLQQPSKFIDSNYWLPISIQCSLNFFSDLERISFFFAVISIISSTVSVVAGGYGSLTQDKIGMLTASSSALVSGIVWLGRTLEMLIKNKKIEEYPWRKKQ